MALPELGEGAAYQDGYLVTWIAPKPKKETEEVQQQSITEELKEAGIELEKVDLNPINQYPKDKNVI